MTDPPDSRHPWSEAMEWVARISAAAGMMVLPGIGGHWLDDRLGTSFCVLLGFAVGLTVGMYYLLLVTGALKRKQSDDEQDREDGA